ncbi:MAG TPA: hypothetical protein VM076_15325 [Gemmatimonadaceae bacterium]|nr:hypothetical protein [Gemmatimonadaceae bacterium]
MTDDEDRMDAVLRQMAADEYNRPPQIVPREQMWEAVQSGIGNRESGIDSTVIPMRRRVPQWVYFAVAAVLLLAAGIQLGRMMGPSTDMAVVPDVPRTTTPDSLGADSIGIAVPDSRVANNDRSDDGKGKPTRPPREPERFANPNAMNESATRAYSVAAAQHMTEAEAMLTAFKGDLSQGRMDTQIASWGKDLLSNTRLLLDSPAAQDPVRRKLLQDLELVLVQIVQLSPAASARDRDLINGALTDDQVLTRLRTAIPLQKGT